MTNVKNFYKGRQKIIEGFKDKIFPYNIDEEWEKDVRYENEVEEVNNVRNENGPIDSKKINRLTDAKERDINDELVRNHFLVQDLGDLLEKLQKSKNNP